jgi:hypothetical protein
VIAALFVQKGGVYWDLPGVDAWDEERDARLYAGPWPVVAHPPCKRWGPLNNLVLVRYPHRAKEFAHGNDGGCFASALASVRRWGGVLEHPANTRAWKKFHLPAPGKRGVWQRGLCGGWSVEVNQAAWGHPARKPTWLYAFGVVLPSLVGSARTEDTGARVRVYRIRNPDGSWTRREPNGPTTEISHRAADSTPPAFRDLLLSIAASSRVAEVA